jgi:hypothetical protein
MSYTVANPGAKPRPGTVSAASALLYLAAVIQVVSIAVSLFSLGPIQDVLNSEFAGTPEADAVATATRVGIFIGIAVSAVFVIGTIVLGLLIGRGSNAARIVTWVLGGIGVLCYTCGLVGNAASSSLANMGGQSEEQADIQRRLEEALPSWQNAANIATSVVLLLCFLLVIILLALPASNDFFRKEQEVWVPPTWPADGTGAPPPPPGGPTGPPPGPPSGPPQ